jgi:hypothetical protein
MSAFHPLPTLDWHDTFADAAIRIRIPRALILLAPLAVGVSAPASAASCGAPLQNWSLINEVPGTSAVQPVNFVFIDAQNRLHWNGNVATESQVREYLGLIAGFQKQSAFPESLTVLGSDPNAACAAVRRMRQMFNDVLGCGHGSCAELGG